MDRVRKTPGVGQGQGAESRLTVFHPPDSAACETNERQKSGHCHLPFYPHRDGTGGQADAGGHPHLAASSLRGPLTMVSTQPVPMEALSSLDGAKGGAWDVVSQNNSASADLRQRKRPGGGAGLAGHPRPKAFLSQGLFIYS